MENDSDDQRTIAHIPYHVSYEDLVQAWLAIFSEKSHCLVIYDPQKHIDYIVNSGLEFDRSKIYKDKVLIVEVENIDDALWLCKNIPHQTGPYVQVWTNSELLTDNIEN